MKPLSRIVPLLLAGCAGDKAGPADDSGGPGGPGAWAPAPLFGVANIDDDDADGEADWETGASADDDDLASLVVPASAFAEGEAVQLALSGATDSVRVWHDGAVVLGGEALEATLDAPAADLELRVELHGFLTEATLSVQATADGEARPVGEVPIRSAPLVLNHHWLQMEQQVAMDIADPYGNSEFIAGLDAVLGDDFLATGGWPYSYDPWIQDEIEFATLTAPGGLRVDVVIDSIRSRAGNYLDDYAEDVHLGPGVGVAELGSGRVTSQDSFGNLEVTPPITAHGVDYPLGRIYWGELNGQGINDELAAIFEAQKVQDPFQVDIGWLCVGHVDEVTTFLPDPSAPRGFRFLVADTTLGLELLDAQDPALELPRYASGHGFATAGELQVDEEVRAYNEDLQVEHIDPLLQAFTDELELTEDEIVRVPSLFERVRWCDGTAVALIPGTINMSVLPRGDGLDLFLADPFFRSDPDDASTDLLIPVFEDLLPEGASVHWLDDWDTYHLGMGEVHCGTNTRRTPEGTWWEDAAHLLDTAEEAR